MEYATKYYAAILARSTGKDLATCQKEYLSRWVTGRDRQTDRQMRQWADRRAGCSIRFMNVETRSEA